MDTAELDARVLGSRQLFERHFGPGVQIEVIRPLVLPREEEAPQDAQVMLPTPGPRILQRPSQGTSLDAVRELLGDCERCPLCRTRTHLVFGVGNPDADLVVLGEAPGEQEDEQGEPFVGRAGAMLDNMLERVVGIRRADAYILNVIKCRPPNNRDPMPDEVGACSPFLERQLAAIRPRAILLMGAVALRALFQTKHGITRHRGEWMDYNGIPVMPTFHPAYLLRKPADKRLTLSDLQALKARLEET
jgi:DNA polymerase